VKSGDPVPPFDRIQPSIHLLLPLLSARSFANSSAALGVAADGRVPVELEREIRSIYGHSPLYGQRFPLHQEPLKWSCYQEIPALSKKVGLNRCAPSPVG